MNFVPKMKLAGGNGDLCFSPDRDRIDGNGDECDYDLSASSNISEGDGNHQLSVGEDIGDDELPSTCNEGDGGGEMYIDVESNEGDSADHLSVGEDIGDDIGEGENAADILRNLKLKYRDNICIANYNINSLRYKFDQLVPIIQGSVDVLIITETKLDGTFPESQFTIEGYSPPYRLDRDVNGGGILVLVREDIPNRALKDHMIPGDIEVLPIEINLRKTKFLLLASYHPPAQSDEYFFDNMTKILDKYNSYEKVLLVGDFNAQENEPCLRNFLCENNLKNIVKQPTCFKNVENPSTIDLFLTNFANSYFSTKTVATGLSDFHKMVFTILRNKFAKRKPKVIQYRCYRNMDRREFRNDLRISLSEANNIEDFHENYLRVLNIHAPLKKKTVRTNQAPYMTKTLRKAIMRRSALKNKYFKNKTLDSEMEYKKQKNFCSKLYKKERRKFYKKLNLNDFTDNKKFWKTIKPFLTDKGSLSSKSISLKEDEEIIWEDREVAEIFNNYFSSLADSLQINENLFLTNKTDQISDPIEKALYKFKDHPSILKIKEKADGAEFTFSEISKEQIMKEIKNLNPRKATTSNSIPTSNIKDNADIAGNILHRIINEDITNSNFPDILKLAEISPLFKDNDKMNRKNYRPVSILPSISKIYEKCMHTQMSSFIEPYLYKNLCGYRNSYNAQFALLTLVETFKKALDNHGYAGVLITDLSKAFDTINHELLLAKLHAYGFERKALKLVHSYLNNRWHKTKINTSYSSWKELLKGVPQGSVLGPLLFNIYFNDLFYFLEETEAINYADDTNLYACDRDLGNLIRRLEHDSLIFIEWFESNYMKLNEKKSHFILSGHKFEHLHVNVGDAKIWESYSEKILGVIIDRDFKFKEYIETVISKAGSKLTALARLSHILPFSKMKLLLESFVKSQFSYCPLVWMFSNRELNSRIDKIQERSLRILYKDDISTFEELLEKDKAITVHDHNIQLLATEMYKVKNDIQPNVLSEFVTNREHNYNSRQPSDFLRDKANSTNFGLESIRILGPKIWDLVPTDIKLSNNLNIFKERIKKWKVKTCPCRLCKVFIQGVGYL